MINEITVDEDILKFLRAIYFGTYKDIYEAASNRAYLDMNRTLRFNGMADSKRKDLRDIVSATLKKEIKGLKNSNVKGQEEFDEWHKSVCVKIQKKYTDTGIIFTIGQSQKWINMMFKYLYMLGDKELLDIFKYLHVPLDNYVFKIAHQEYGIQKPSIVWSKWENYEEQYLKYQKDLRSKIDGQDPLRWEFEYWLKAAREYR